jgi:hypothetical protein
LSNAAFKDSVEQAKHKILPVLDPAIIVIFKRLFKTLNKVHQHQSVTKMPASNLAIVFCPNFVASANPLQDLQVCSLEQGMLGSVVAAFIERYDDIFSS